MIILDDYKWVIVGVGLKIDVLKSVVIIIICEVKGVLKFKVSWIKDGWNILLGEWVVLGFNGIIIIWDFSVDDSGNYMCIVRSRIG